MVDEITNKVFDKLSIEPGALSFVYTTISPELIIETFEFVLSAIRECFDDEGYGRESIVDLQEKIQFLKDKFIEKRIKNG